jgi:hypothetical protein
MLRLTIGPYTFDARLERRRAPRTCEAVQALLPIRGQVIHVRWSGEAVWFSGNDNHLPLGYENNTSFPAPGELLLYPGGISEMEILLPYGPTMFSSKSGQLSGNHFATIVNGQEHLQQLGHLVLWQGAQDLTIEG